MRRILLFIAIMTLSGSSLLYGQNPNRKSFTVVIDPGHGGKDGGCDARSPQTGKLEMEKVFVLAISQKLQELISAELPEVSTVMTRSTDVFVELYKRAEIANRAEAQLFVSIHINKSANATAHGMRCYVMGTDSRSEADNMTALRENGVIQYEEDYQTRYANYDANSPESKIIFRLMQDTSLEQSFRFAEMIQSYCNTDLKEMMTERMVNSQNLSVLRNTMMPSVLVEVGFISNSEDFKRLQSEEFQNRVARVLFNAVKEYRNTVSQTTVITTTAPSPTKTVTTATTATSPAPTKTASETPADTSTGAIETTTSNQPAVSATTVPALFYIQISSLAQSKPIDSRDFKSYAGKVVMRQIGGRYKYFVGGVSAYSDIVKMLADVKREFADAFIVAFRGEEQIPVSEARS